MRKALLFICWLAAMPCMSQPAPSRIVSMNLCSDLQLLSLVEKQRIVSLSSLATNPLYSPLAAEAVGIASNRAQADEVLQYQPDLVLTSVFSASQAANLLQRLGYRVERLEIPDSVSAVFRLIEHVGELTGTQSLAKTRIDMLQQEIAAITSSLETLTAGKSAVFLSGNGYSHGAGTLQDDFIKSLGMQNVAADAGLIGPAPLHLETLVHGMPDFIFMNTARPADQYMAMPLSKHPALRSMMQDSRLINLQDAWFECGDVHILAAYRKLAGELLVESVQE